MRNIVIKTTMALAAFAATSTMFTTTTEAKTVVIQAASPALAAGSSYAWAPTSSAVLDRADPALANAITGTRLRIAVETALAAHGYRRSDYPAAADLAVSFHVALEQKQGVKVSDNGATFCGWRGCVRRWPSSATVTEFDYTQGALVLDLVDRTTGELVWRAASEKRVSARDVSQARLNAIVADMMKSLPMR